MIYFIFLVNQSRKWAVDQWNSTFKLILPNQPSRVHNASSHSEVRYTASGSVPRPPVLLRNVAKPVQSAKHVHVRIFVNGTVSYRRWHDITR